MTINIETLETLIERVNSLKGKKLFENLSHTNQQYFCDHCKDLGLVLTVAQYRACEFTSLDTQKAGE